MNYPKIINKAKQNLDASLNIKIKARELRKRMTEQEKILWDHIRGRKQHGMYFRRQHPYGIYILDFYCFEADLVIEIDGMIHLSRHEYDLERTKYLESTGLKVLRFKNEDIENRIEWVLDEIRFYLVHLPLSRPVSKEKEAIISPLGEIRKGVK